MKKTYTKKELESELRALMQQADADSYILIYRAPAPDMIIHNVDNGLEFHAEIFDIFLPMASKDIQLNCLKLLSKTLKKIARQYDIDVMAPHNTIN